MRCPFCRGLGWVWDDDQMMMVRCLCGDKNSDPRPISNFREEQGKRAGAKKGDTVNLRSWNNREVNMNSDEENDFDIDPPTPKRKKAKSFNAKDLLHRMQYLQDRADLTGKEEEVWDDFGYVGTLFPRKSQESDSVQGSDTQS